MKIGGGDIIQILFLTVAVYYVLNLFRRTRSAQMFRALGVIGAIVFVLAFVANSANWQVLSWLITKLIIYLAFALVIIFQPEIRQTLATFGRKLRTTSRSNSSVHRFIDDITDVAAEFSIKKTGALVAIERQILLNGYCENGTMLNAPFVPKLLSAIFFPNAPLHDGGVIIRGDTIIAARCLFPLSDSKDITYGTRHRAGVGLSEQTDAIVVIVSEETGNISIAYNGRLIHDLTPAQLHRYLHLLMPSEGITDAIRRSIEELEAERNPHDTKSAAHKNENVTAERRNVK